MLGCRPICTLLEQHQLQGSSESSTILYSTRQFQHLVGRLLYLTITRSEILYATSILSQFVTTQSNSLGYCGANFVLSQRISQVKIFYLASVAP